jgi:hypothetical protein
MVVVAALLGGLIALSSTIQPPAGVRAAALFVHLASMAIGLGAVLAVDWYGLMWARGRLALPAMLIHAHHLSPPIWIGLAGLTCSGILLEPQISSPLTAVKLGCVVALGVIGVLALSTKRQMIRRLPDVPPLLLVRGLVLSVASQACWWTALVIGFLTREGRA